MRGTFALTWGHVALWRTFFNAQSLCLHFRHRQLHSGELNFDYKPFSELYKLQPHFTFV